MPLRILVAEDDSLSAMALQEQLEYLGHTVIGPAPNGRVAVELAQQHPIDFVILDIRMPIMNGFEAAREIFRIKPVPIMLLSGYTDPEQVEQAGSAPVFHYLVKPIEVADLAPAITLARYRFQEWHRLKQETSTLERKIDERKLIERAKGIIMETRGFSESQAYKLLQKESQNRNQPMGEIARSIVMAHALLSEAGEHRSSA